MDWGFMAFAIASTLSLAAGGVLLLVGYIGTVPAAFSFGLKTGLPVLLVPVIGPVWFALTRGPEFRRSAIQLIVGVALVALATGLILGLGPQFAEKLAAEMIEAAKNR
ncbi:MAG: hypothetical protein KGP14_05045 [Betaproteobacteria bacterium]|nr:hypothetical protein [Betaproteobacteria bacterium]